MAKSARISRRVILGAACLMMGGLFPKHKAGLAGTVLPESMSESGPLGRTFYVANSGRDSNPGTIQRPFRTISRVFKAVPDLGANDVVMVMPGTYREQVVVTNGGDASGYLTLRSWERRGALIRSPKRTYSAINIVRDYVVIEGFDVRAGGDGHGIEATFLDGNPKNNGPHHIKILNNFCHDSPGSGISVAFGDWFMIEGNICFRNCHSNKYQGSGISIYETRAISELTPGFHNFVRKNVCFLNSALDLTEDPEPPHSDGNGIIIDDLRNTQTGNLAGNYAFGTLVENNLVYANGGKGIQIFLSDNVMIRNNTSFLNNRDLLNPSTWRGDLSNVSGSNNSWINNISVADPQINKYNTAISDHDTPDQTSKGVIWYNNITFNGKIGDASIHSRENTSLTTRAPYSNILGADPDFVNPDIAHNPDFHLKPNSPAIDAGTEAFGVASTDLDDNPRVVGGRIDIGAYEDQS